MHERAVRAHLETVMATYTQFEIANSPGVPWKYSIGSSYSATASTLTFADTDGSVTKALGSFVVLQGTLFGGVISTLEHTSTNGATIYENITGLSLDANV